VRLPIAAQTSNGEAPVREQADPQEKARYRILIADDNGDAVESMGMMLRLMGNEVRTVRDGAQAVEEAAAFRPDMVLLDIGMPRMNGYDAAQHIRQQRWGSRMMLVALTGWGQEEDKRRAADAGFDLHFTKPVSADDLEKLMAGRFAPASPGPRTASL
jgi:CheY-like chemotaxis protein